MDITKLNKMAWATGTRGGLDKAIVTNKKCPICGGTLECISTVILTTYPAQYYCNCKECNYSASYACHEIVLTYDTDKINNGESAEAYTPEKLIPDCCSHVYDIVESNGKLMTFCKLCGKIGDVKKYDQI